MTTPENPPAFPQSVAANDAGDHLVSWDYVGGEGMMLRDYFSAKAMAALLSQMTIGNQGQHCAMYDPNDPAQASTLAFLSYQAADAMLAARAEKG